MRNSEDSKNHTVKKCSWPLEIVYWEMYYEPVKPKNSEIILHIGCALKKKKTWRNNNSDSVLVFCGIFHLLTPQFALEQQKLTSSVVVTLSCSLKTRYIVRLAILYYNWLLWIQVVLNVVTEPPTTSWCKLRLRLVSRLHRIARWWYLCPDGVGADISLWELCGTAETDAQAWFHMSGQRWRHLSLGFFMFLLSSYIHQIIFEKNFGYFW